MVVVDTPSRSAASSFVVPSPMTERTFSSVMLDGLRAPPAKPRAELFPDHAEDVFSPPLRALIHGLADLVTAGEFGRELAAGVALRDPP